jgi:2-iminobutanoate/2-iminopropanoate deaminase
VTKVQVPTKDLSAPVGHFSQAIAVTGAGRLVFLSGMTARRPDGSVLGAGDIEAQTRQACENVRSAVEVAGGTMEHIVRVDVFVRNIEHFEIIHRIRREYFPPPPPASTLVEVAKLVDPEMLIEITAIAVLPEGSA